VVEVAASKIALESNEIKMSKGKLDIKRPAPDAQVSNCAVKDKVEPAVATAEKGMVVVLHDAIERMRFAGWLGRQIRMELAAPSNSVANRQIASTRLVNMMEKLHVRRCDMVRVWAHALDLVFLPTLEEVQSHKRMGTVEAEQLRKDSICPVTQRENVLPAWFQSRVPGWVNHLPWFHRTVRTDQKPLN